MLGFYNVAFNSIGEVFLGETVRRFKAGQIKAAI